MHQQAQQQAEDIACSLDGKDFASRAAEWRAVARHATERIAQPGRVSARYPGELRIRLARLVEAEAACCPFLAFEIRDEGDSIRLELTYPPEAEAMIGQVLA